MNAPQRTRRWSARNVTAVLGPTNTGKTHLAIERMLGHESGMIGLPLRLLAREVYSRVAARAGADQVALVTGEEKILPAQPRYWVSTVEAMPRETDAAFVAIDEVQIAADLERGHIFTDRILNLRGTQETLLLGAATMRGIIEQLLPGVHVVTRPRMSVLAYSGQKKLTRLPERSAIVAFSADEVYAVGELIRRQRGGAAVVLGALSPRSRNKQVEIYQSGDVDFLVATDAIGMGLNLDLDHVAFASNRKYDGYQFRELSAAELGQIAGRAGRHMHDGTFGVTGRVDPFPDPLVEALETHRFEPVRTVQWRNNTLDFASLAALKASLDETPQVEGLTRAQPADDRQALEALGRDEEIAGRVHGSDGVRRLWDAAQLPDYRKISPAQHAHLVGEIFCFINDGGVVPEDWIADQIRQADRTDGDIDTLSARIAHIRTWAFVANQADWLAEPSTWRDETKAVEDKLSDALHERLTKRFVDRRTSVLMRRLRENTVLDAEITPTGDVLVEGHQVGTLQGFRFTPDLQGGGAEGQALRGAAQKSLAAAITDRADRLARAADTEIVLSLDGHLRWQGEPIARLMSGEDLLKPRFVLLADEQLTGASREAVERRIETWLAAHVGTLLKPLIDLTEDQSLAGMARGIAFQLMENMGVLDRRTVLAEVRGLDQDARASLRRHGVRFGAYHIYVPALLKPGPSTLVAQLWALKHRSLDLPGLAELPTISASGRTSVAIDPSFDPELYRRFGFRIYGSRAIRIDILERLADLIRPALSWSPGAAGERPSGAVEEGRGFTVTSSMTSLLGASGDAMAVVLKGLGYRMERRPKPPEKVPPASVAEGEDASETATPTPEEAGAESQQPVAVEEPAATEPVAAAPVSEAAASPETDGEAIEESATQEAAGEETPAQGASAEDAPAPSADVAAATEEPATSATTADAGETAEPSTEAETTAEPGAEAEEPAELEMIEVWRLAPSRPKHHRPRKPRHDGARDAGTGGTEDRHEKRGRPHKRKADGKHRPRRGERDGGERPQWQKRPPRERPVDPDNPFAALEALKKELEKSGRE
jgi:ATP-dependent RNA helicase SUPV3L1/SUV3